VPVLINTSFNMHEEPMVRTPTDAIRAWQESGIEALWLGDHLLKQ
jgi:carbamoyltransferase